MSGCGLRLDGGAACGGPISTPTGPRAFHAGCVPSAQPIAINVDLGAMQWDIRLALLIKMELEQGWCWQRKDGKGMAQTFSESLVQIAGGIRRLLAEWEPEPGSPLAKQDAAK